MLLNAFWLAIREIRRNLLRSFLTVLGIVIGVSSVIAMVMLGDGTTASVTQNIAKLGSNMLIVQPGQERRGPGSGSDAPMFKQSDIDALKSDVYGIRAISGVSTRSASAVYANTTYTTTVTGANSSYLDVRDWAVADGRAFSHSEEIAGKSVCMIGESVKKELFKNSDPIGRLIRVDKFSCEVIGLLESKGASSFGMDQDDLIIVPQNLFQRRISGNFDIRFIYISLEPKVDAESVKSDITSLLREKRKLRVEQMDNFFIRDTKELMATLTQTTKTLTMLLGSVAAISLLVGGIGIMNIMLVSVTERTREIGIRLAIGALEKEVLMQFLVEAVVLSSFGGVVGIGLGLWIAVFVTDMFEIPYIFNSSIVVIAFLFSTAVGVIFGYFPARKAAKLDPIEALRHE